MASAAVLFVGLPVLAPALREEYALSLSGVGVLLATAWIGGTLTLLPWGLAADRFGERLVMAAGPAGSARPLGRVPPPPPPVPPGRGGPGRVPGAGGW